MQGQLSSDLRKALIKKLVSPEDTERLIQELTLSGYLNDQAWIESYIRINIQKKNGPTTIIRKLMMKGIPSEKAKKVVNQQAKPKDVQESIKRLLETKHKNKDLSNFKEKQKVIASLMRKGFALDTIKTVLDCSDVFDEENEF